MKPLTLLCLVAACLLTATAAGQGKKVELADLPPAVSHAVQRKLKDAKLTDAKVTQVHEAKAGGKPGYRVKFFCKTKLADKSEGAVWVTREGKFIHGYRGTNLDELPKAVLGAFLAKFKTFKKVKMIVFIHETYSGDEVSFTIGITEGKKSIDLEFGPNGKLLRNEVMFEDK